MCFSELESESIEIIHEVTATATKPVMLYWIGEDASVRYRTISRGRASTPMS